jgi:REP element-mobilizing transposase RayT
LARPLRINIDDGLYHITSRGNEKAYIYLEDLDRHVFLKYLAGVVKRYDWVVYAYCLMGNHYHLMVRTPKANISLGLHQPNGHYAQYFNKHHSRVGHVFQGRFGSVLIRNEERLLTVARYVVLNPIRAAIVASPDMWPWSSYRCTAGMVKPPTFLDPDQVLCYFSSLREEAFRQYASFVYEGIGTASPFSEARGGIILGEGETVREAFEKIEAEISSEIPRRERYAARPEMVEVFSENGRNQGIYLAVHQYGYKLKEVGDFLGMHYSVVSRVSNKVAHSVSQEGFKLRRVPALNATQERMTILNTPGGNNKQDLTP